MEQRRHHLGLGLVLISGEGGVGKTSLALRIAGWALEGRLTERAVVPVLVEADLQGEESLLSRVRSSLEALTEQRGPEARALAPTLPQVRALLERRRLLVILDHFSELGDESRQRLLPTADDFPSAWAIVTSRREESFGGKVVLHLRPPVDPGNVAREETGVLNPATTRSRRGCRAEPSPQGVKGLGMNGFLRIHRQLSGPPQRLPGLLG